jgi:hypothetical protein
MSLINHEELKKQLASGEITSLDDITPESKNILKEVIHPASQEELTSHLGGNTSLSIFLNSAVISLREVISPDANCFFNSSWFIKLICNP